MDRPSGRNLYNKLMLTKETKTEVIKKFSGEHMNPGSALTQSALITERIKQISAHLKTHKKDYAGQRGLLMLVGQRRRLMNYLKRKDPEGYNKVLKQLDLRK
jgi:small subunit ribosomal protein S15